VSAAPAGAIPALLVARAQLGDREAIDGLLRLLQEPLRAHVAAIVHDDDLALDVMQQVLWTIARKVGTVDDPRWVRAWAYRVATREAVRRSRSERRWREALRDDAAAPHLDASDDGAADDRWRAELQEELRGAIDRLPSATAAVLRLHYLDDLTLAETAEALEIPLGTAKSRLAYGLAALRNAMASR